MSLQNLQQWHKLFDRWNGLHRWQNYDSMKAVYPSYEEFCDWFTKVDFRLYNVYDKEFLVTWGVGHHGTLGKLDRDLFCRDGTWFKLYNQVSQLDQWTLDGTIKVMISLLQNGPLARCNLRVNGRPSINKGAKLAWASWLLNLECPLVVAHPLHDIPAELDGAEYRKINTISELETVYPEPSRAVLLPRTYGEGPHNIDAWTLHKGWDTYKDEAHTQFPIMDWDKWFTILWDWARQYEYDVFSVHHRESAQEVLFPVVNVGFNEWLTFWKLCAKERLLDD